MEFWVCEVKSGESSKVQPGKGMVLRLSQANVGKFDKGRSNESLSLFVNVDGKELVLGSLSSKKLPQQQFDMLFDRDFELSHDWKGGSVFFFGYAATNPQDIPKIEENPNPEENGKPEEEESSSSDSSSDDSTPRFIENHKLSSESSDSESEDDSEEDTPAKVVPVKTCASKLETPAASKKVTVTTLQKTGGKKGGVALVPTSHSPMEAFETKLKRPKYDEGSLVCKTCKRPFDGSEKTRDSKLETATGGKKGGVALVATPHLPKKVEETSCSTKKQKKRKQ